MLVSKEAVYIAVIEAGGTKFNCAIVDLNRNFVSMKRIDTTTPEQTLKLVIAYFNEQKEAGFNFEKLGLACFGPLDLNKQSSDYGSITATPKPDWSNTPITSILEAALNCTIFLDTDVNAAALAEYKWGNAINASVAIYITIGTGVGGGVVINGKPLHGLIHPEIGHMIVSPPKGIQGVCPFHGNCIEGLAAGRSMAKIWNQPAETLPDDHQAWDIQAQILASLCHNLMLNFSPEKIILGGGVMNKPGLLEKIISYTQESLNGYITLPNSLTFANIISLPGLDQYSGLLGAFALTQQQ